MDYEFKLQENTSKTKTSIWRRLAIATGVVILGVVIALAGVFIGNVAEEKSIDYRTDASTEVHKVLGDVFVHTGDNKPISRVEIGKIFFVHNKYIKIETCHSFTSNVFWGIENHVVHHYSMFTNWFKAGTYEADEYFVVPKTIPAGKYRIIKKTVSFCNGKEHYTTNFDVAVEFYKAKK